MSCHGEGLERDRHHVGPNLLYQGLGEAANSMMEVGEWFFEFKPGGGELKDKATKPPAFDVVDLQRVVMLGLVLLGEPYRSYF